MPRNLDRRVEVIAPVPRSRPSGSSSHEVLDSTWPTTAWRGSWAPTPSGARCRRSATSTPSGGCTTGATAGPPRAGPGLSGRRRGRSDRPQAHRGRRRRRRRRASCAPPAAWCGADRRRVPSRSSLVHRPGFDDWSFPRARWIRGRRRRALRPPRGGRGDRPAVHDRPRARRVPTTSTARAGRRHVRYWKMRVAVAAAFDRQRRGRRDRAGSTSPTRRAAHLSDDRDR